MKYLINFVNEMFLIVVEICTCILSKTFWCGAVCIGKRKLRQNSMCCHSIASQVYCRYDFRLSNWHVSLFSITLVWLFGLIKFNHDNFKCIPLSAVVVAGTHTCTFSATSSTNLEMSISQNNCLENTSLPLGGYAGYFFFCKGGAHLFGNLCEHFDDDLF